MKAQGIGRLWPVLAITAAAAAAGVPLLAYPNAEDRGRTAMHEDCPEKAKKSTKRQDWGWRVFNGRVRSPVL